jgi:hypothetical protein
MHHSAGLRLPVVAKPARLARLNDLRHVKPVDTPPPPHAPAAVPDSQQTERRCPKCGSIMRLVGDIKPTRFRLHGARASP